MRALLQRVSSASVDVDGQTVGACGPGLLVLLAVAPEDGEAQVEWMTQKVVGLRIFADDEGRMNRSVLEVGGGALVVSQFTLYGDASRGRRPSYTGSARPEVAEPLYRRFCERLAALGVPTARGVFGAHMQVKLVNDGPVTLLVDSP